MSGVGVVIALYAEALDFRALIEFAFEKRESNGSGGRGGNGEVVWGIG